MTPRYIRQFQVLEQDGEVAYKLDLPPSLSVVHPVCQLSMLKRYVPDNSHKLSYEGLDVRSDLSYEEEAARILDRLLRTLRCREVPLVKVLWSKQGVEEATWEHEDDKRALFPKLLVISRGSSFFSLVLVTFLSCV